MSVIVDISDERLRFTSGDRSLGDWPLDKLSVVSLPDGFHLRLEDEEIVLTVPNPDEFFGCLRNGRGAAQDAIAAPSTGNDPTTDVLRAVDDLARAMGEDTVPPDQIFATWLGLLKEINRRHAQSEIPSPVFIRLNTDLLNMLPVPGA